MPKHTQRKPQRPLSILPAYIGARLNLDRQRGDEHAKLLWFFVLAHTPWGSTTRPTWATDTTLMLDAGLQHRRHAERAMFRLRAADMLSCEKGLRKPRRGKATFGRILATRLADPVKVVVPNRGQMAILWRICGKASQRPAALVTAAVGLHVLACHASGGKRITTWARVTESSADVRRFVGARKGHAWNQRLRDLEQLGLVRREADGIWVAPPCEWTGYVPEVPAENVGRPLIPPPSRMRWIRVPRPRVPEIPAWFDEIHAHAVYGPGWESGVSMSV